HRTCESTSRSLFRTTRFWRWRSLMLSFISALDCGDVEFFHFQESVNDALGLHGIRICHHLRYDRRHDLPRQAIFILQPATGALLAVLRKPAPEIIDIGLRLAMDL